jgi:hypothetical protein
VPSPGDHLAQQVRAIAATMVPPSEVEKVSRLAALVLLAFMEDPRLVGQLRIVNELQQENLWLRNQLVIAQGALVRSAPVKRPVKKRAPAKKSQARAFKQGVRDVRGRR